MNYKFLTFLSIILFSFPLRSFSNDTPKAGAPSIVRHVYIFGNHTTKTETIKLFLTIDSGMVFDSNKVLESKRLLLKTGLFSKVDLFPLFKSDGVHIYVILNEKFYISLYDIGGEYYNYKYGKKEFWWDLHGGIEETNFRGKMEDLRFSVSFWDWRSLSLSWYKPLLPSPWFFDIGASIDHYPDELLPLDYTDLVGRASFGRKILTHSKAMISIIPAYTHEVLNSGQTDTLTFNNTKELLNGKEILKIYEAYGALGWVTDERNSPFDPSNGWYFSGDLRTNHIYAGESNPFFQLSTDLRLYQKGFFSKDKFACRIRSVLRNTNAGFIHRLHYGGPYSVRGYNLHELGWKFIANDALLFSTEYRFPIYELPPLRFPILSNISNLSNIFSSIVYRIDGAVIFDYGRLTPTYSDFFAINSPDQEIAIGFGAGLRVHVTPMEYSVCFDIVSGKDLDNGNGKLNFRKPLFVLYFGMPY